MSVFTTAASTTAVTVLPANINRKNFLVYNDSVDQIMYMKLGAGATTTDFSLPLLPGNYYEPPNYTENRNYSGEISAVWAAASGSARVTEW